MTLADLHQLVLDHYGLVSTSTLLLILLILSKLISISKLNLDPWGWLTSIPHRLGDMMTASLQAEVVELAQSVKALDTNYREDRKRTLRRSILRFSDECRIKQKHSKEMFDTVLMEITEYENLCKDTNDPNHVISEAINFITKLYNQCQSGNDFL